MDDIIFSDGIIKGETNILRRMLSDSAQKTATSLPIPLSPPSTSGYKTYRWTKGSLNFEYLIDGIFSTEDLALEFPDYKVEFLVKSEYSRDIKTQLHAGIREHFKKRKDVKVQRHPHAGLSISAPAKTFNEIKNLNVTIRDIDGDFPAQPTEVYNYPTEIQKEKQKEFLVELISPYQPHPVDQAIKIVPIDAIRYQDIFTNPVGDPTGGCIEVLDFVEYMSLLERFYILDRNSCKNIIKMSFKHIDDGRTQLIFEQIKDIAEQSKIKRQRNEKNQE